MTYRLVVVKPFEGFRRGDVITDEAAIQKILAGSQASFVVRVSVGKE